MIATPPRRRRPRFPCAHLARRVGTVCVAAVFGVVVLAGTGSLAAQRDDVRELSRRFDEAYRAQDWVQAAEVGRELAQRLPDRPIVAFNLACVLARSGDSSAAIKWLARASDLGFDRVEVMDEDPDLDSLRDAREFSSVRAAVAANLERRRAAAGRHAASSPLLIVAPDRADGSASRPLVVVLHGYGDRPDHHPPFWGPAARDFDAILAFPEGPERVGDGRGWGGVEEADVIVRATLERLAADFEIDRDRIVLAGFSQGGFMAMALGIRHRDLVRGVVAVAGPYIPEVDAPPPARAGDPRFFFLVGGRDRNASGVRRAADDFSAAGYASRLRVVPGLGHGLPRSSDKELGRALRFVLERN
jgi:predicted esterase